MTGAPPVVPARWPVVASGVSAAVLLLGLAWWLRPLDPDVLALQMAATSRRFAEVIHRWSPEQLALFRAHLPIDGLLLLSYGLFGPMLVARTAVFARVRPWERQAARLALPLAAGFDAMENLLHAWLTEVPRFGLVWPYPVATGCALLKWAGIATFGVLVAMALLKAGDDD